MPVTASRSIDIRAPLHEWLELFRWIEKKTKEWMLDGGANPWLEREA
jgi:hypothetical protein